MSGCANCIWHDADYYGDDPVFYYCTNNETPYDGERVDEDFECDRFVEEDRWEDDE